MRVKWTWIDAKWVTPAANLSWVAITVLVTVAWWSSSVVCITAATVKVVLYKNHTGHACSVINNKVTLCTNMLEGFDWFDRTPNGHHDHNHYSKVLVEGRGRGVHSTGDLECLCCLNYSSKLICSCSHLDFFRTDLKVDYRYLTIGIFPLVDFTSTNEIIVGIL